MGRFAIVIYRPYQGKETALLDLIRTHRATTLAKGLTTEFRAIYMRDSNQDILEIFEWSSQQTINQAKTDPEVAGSLWPDLEQVCDMLYLSSITESQEDFPCFERMDIISPEGLSSIEEGRYVITCYSGFDQSKEKELTHAIVNHYQLLKDRGLVTDFEPLYLRSSGGQLLGLYEMRSDEAVGESEVQAESGKQHKALWSGFEGLCDFCPLSALPEASLTYPTFARVILNTDMITVETPA